MRMWMVEPNKMCRKHLLGEHVELHMFVGVINKGNDLEGYFKKKLVCVSEIKKRHDDLVNEMKTRGYNHKSELPDFKWDKLECGEIDVNENIQELKLRCKECKF